MSLLFWRKTRDTGSDQPSSLPVSETHPLPVELFHGDENDIAPVRIDSGRVDSATSTPICYNVTLTSADTEYSQAMPANCRRFEFQCRTEFACRFAFENGKVAGSTAPYMTLKAGDYYESGPIHQKNGGSTLYLASATAGVVIELLVWV